MTSSLYLSDIIKRVGLDVNKVKLIRHSLNDSEFKACYETGFMKEYTQCQKEGFTTGYEYILNFVGNSGTSAKFKSCYKIKSHGQPISKEFMPDDFPFESMFSEKIFYYDFEICDLFSDLNDRLIIEWKAPRSWHQNAKIEKSVLAIQESAKHPFNGFENVILSFEQLKEIVSDSVLYENWHTALSSVYAIYLLTDTVTGKQYIGSAYGKQGLLGRWSNYVDSKHGSNKRIIELLCQHADRYKFFQYSILQILPKNLTDDEVVKIENLYKSKLLSKKFGLNDN